MVAEEHSVQPWGPLPGEDWRAHRMRVFADYPERLAVLRIAESKAHEAEIWREWHLHLHEGDPEMQAIIRESQFDLDAPPEMDLEDLQPTAEERASNDRGRLVEQFFRYFAARYPEQAHEVHG